MSKINCFNMALTPVNTLKTEPLYAQPAKGSMPPCPPPQKPPASIGQAPIAPAPPTKTQPLSGQPLKGSEPPCPPPQKPPASIGQVPIAPAPPTKTQPLTGQPLKGSEPLCPPPQKPPASIGQTPIAPAPPTKTEPLTGQPLKGSELSFSAPNQHLKGTTGKDLLEAKIGIDRLTGLSGADTFYFSGKPSSCLEKAIHITDFSASEGDQIHISKNALGSVLNTTNAVATISSPANLSDACKADNLFIYDSSSGFLYINQNSNKDGFGSGGVFAILDNHATLNSANLSII